MGGSRQARRRSRAAGVHRPPQARALERRSARHIRRAQARPAERRARTRGNWPCRSPLSPTRSRSPTTSRSRRSRLRVLRIRDSNVGCSRRSSRPPGSPRATSARRGSCCGSSRGSANRRSSSPSIATRWRGSPSVSPPRATRSRSCTEACRRPSAAARSTAFNDSGGILIATDAASEGLNLHHRCRVVIHFELPWNPSRLEQRAGRVDRLGQTRRVHELALVAAHTAERLVVAPLVTRLAATATKRGRMLDALTESRVAEAVMQNMEPARVIVEQRAATPAFAVPPPEDLASQAVREAARLEHHRRLVARSSLAAEAEAGQRAVAAALRRRTRVPPGLYLVFALTLMGADGSRAARRSAARSRRTSTGFLRSPLHSGAVARSHSSIARSSARGRPAATPWPDSSHCAANGSSIGRRRSPTCSLLASRPRRGCWSRRACSIAARFAPRRHRRHRSRRIGKR